MLTLKRGLIPFKLLAQEKKTKQRSWPTSDASWAHASL